MVKIFVSVFESESGSLSEFKTQVQVPNLWWFIDWSPFSEQNNEHDYSSIQEWYTDKPSFSPFIII